jgi:diguanylate cyclase (GGDEF)-like protein
VLSLLKSIESISSCRDRRRLSEALLQAMAALFGKAAKVGIFAREIQGETVLRQCSAPSTMNSAVAQWFDFLDEVRIVGMPRSRSIGGCHCGALMLEPSELIAEHLFLAYELDQADLNRHSEMVACLARIYGSQIKLLDYSELDTLTGLLNRKTFDETFERLLNASCVAPRDDIPVDHRKLPGDKEPAWLCVIDIDHFKRVNDSFGHLFGDEVLLRMGEHLRKTFRGSDRLFRFGGEEFIVVLNAPNESLAATSFNRFRESLEQHEFPQIGKVTCSIGFTRVSGGDVPTDVVGRADEALYYAKEHGRNRVCCYERLVSDGVIAKPAPVESRFAEDIDALFG